ncbi:flagellin [Swingsia samuiensis]|nr:flagellin [Swingsia samuiensis]
MSEIISSFGNSNFSNFQTFDLNSLENKKNNLQEEVSSGVLSGNYTNLGSNRIENLNLQPTITKINALNNNIKISQTDLSIRQNYVGSLIKISNNFNLLINSFSNNVSQKNISDLQNQAKVYISDITNLINSQKGNKYIFSDINDNIPPISEDINTSSLNKEIKSIVNNYSGKNSNSILSLAQQAVQNSPKNKPFSSSVMSFPNANIKMPSNSESIIKNLFSNLMIVSSVNVGKLKENYNPLLKEVLSSNSKVIQGLENINGSMGIEQNNLQHQSSLLSQNKDILTSQLNSTRDADLATVSVQLNDINNQLQASYSLIAKMSDFSLTRYL